MSFAEGEMEEAYSGGRGSSPAQFVMKTYGMVDDPATDMVITWGRENNSFVVVDPFTFSQYLLPVHFKHNNFSSFIRQLNTYGFRKVAPDRWEFAHGSFLRGHTHLLRHIVRRSSGSSKRKKEEGEAAGDEEDGDEEEVHKNVWDDVAKLWEEQRSTEAELQRMWRRIEELETKPKQMLAFLLKVANDPDFLRRLADRALPQDGGPSSSAGGRLEEGRTAHRRLETAEAEVVKEEPVEVEPPPPSPVENSVVMDDDSQRSPSDWIWLAGQGRYYNVDGAFAPLTPWPRSPGDMF